MKQDKSLDSHESKLRNALVNQGPLPPRFYDSLKASEDRGISNYLYSAVQAVERIHPRDSKGLSNTFVIKASKESHFKQVMTFDGRQGVFGQVLIETMKFNINMFLTIYDKLVMPFYGMMQENSGEQKSKKLTAVLGYILSTNEDDEYRENLVEQVLSVDNADELEHKICHLEERLAEANEEAAVAKRSYNDLVAQRNSELFYVANNPRWKVSGQDSYWCNLQLEEA